MTDIESLRQRDKQFNIEEKLVCCVWVHDRYLNGKTFGMLFFSDVFV